MDADKAATATFRSAIDPFVGHWVNIDPNAGTILQAQLTEISPTTATLHVWQCTGTGTGASGNDRHPVQR
jgi:hypothetical protein